jgi:hypothetical protein
MLDSRSGEISSHSRGRAQCTMNCYEIIGKMTEGCGSRVVLYLVGESTGQAGVSLRASADDPVLGAGNNQRESPCDYREVGNLPPKANQPA